jgi:hypothetical protein
MYDASALQVIDSQLHFGLAELFGGCHSKLTKPPTIEIKELWTGMAEELNSAG